MTATGHALIGALIAAKFHNPAIALPLSFASHFVADMIPHWDSGTHWRKKSREQLITESVIDVLVGFGAAMVLYVGILQQYDIGLLFLSIISAQLPDWLSAPTFILGMKIPLLNEVEKIQSKLNTKLDRPWGVVTQIATVIGLYLALFRIGF